MKKTIIVMPVANEEDSIANVISEIRSLYKGVYLYIIMDSYSKDKTEEIARSFEDEFVKVIFYKESKGVVSCYLEGFRRALADGAEQIIEMDGGGSHNPKEIKLFLEKLDEGYDCVFGSRFMKGGAEIDVKLFRRIVSKWGTWLANIVLGTKLTDMTSGFEGFKSEVLSSFNFENFLSRAHMYQTEMRFYCRKTKHIEVPIHYVGGRSTFKKKILFRAFSILFKLKENEKKVKRKDF